MPIHQTPTRNRYGGGGQKQLAAKLSISYQPSRPSDFGALAFDTLPLNNFNILLLLLLLQFSTLELSTTWLYSF